MEKERFERAMMNRRKFHNRKGASSVTFTKNEAYAMCYYLFNMFENVSNVRIIEELDAVHLFMNLVHILELEDRLKSVLSAEISNFEKKGILNPVDYETPDCDSYFCDSDIPYSYVQDKKIDRKIRRVDEVNEIFVNICRMLYVLEKPVFSAIINTAVFRTGKDLKLTSELKISKNMADAIFDISKTKFLVDQVKLSEDEARFILMMFRFSTVEDFRCIFRNSNDYDSNGFKDCMAAILGISESDYRTMLRSDNKIRSFGFIDEEGEYDSFLNECIEEQSIEPYFNDLLKPLDCSSAFPLESYSINENFTGVCMDLLTGKNPVSILFYGKPGSGKTELAKTICKNSGKKVFIFKNEIENSRCNVLGRLVCLLSMERTDSILIVDEADNILKTLEFSFFGTCPTKTKGTVNKMLENNKDKVIYIINHQHQIDESTLRRFTFSIKFENMSPSMLRSIAKTKLEPMNIDSTTKDELLNMLDKFRLTGSSVDNIVKVIDGMECKDEEILLSKAQIVMKENSLLLNGKSKMRDTVRAEYDPKVLNASMNPLKIVEMVKNAEKYAEKNKGTESGIRMLFYGLSGTGKTELARYISEQLGKQIILKRASDIFGMYVGQNEKNIRNAFAEAESQGAILLFDEADSFFADRNNARTSWERSTVNEFLTQMEEFSGILICTTNLRKIMDPAMQRRFHLLVEFKPMKFDGIKKMAERYFEDIHLSNSQIEELEDSNSVTPGDFGTLSSRIRFMNPDDVDAEYIMEELKKLQKEKEKKWDSEESEGKKKIGFCG